MPEILFGCLLGLTPLVMLIATNAYSSVVTYLQEVGDQSEYY